MTARQMLSLLRDRLREICPDSFPDGYLVQELNVAQAALVAKTRCLVDSATTTTVAGTQKYAVPTDSVKVLAAEYDGKRLPEHAIASILDAEAATGIPYAFAVFADEVWLYPTPDAAKTLRTYYVRRPAALSVATLDTASDLSDEWAGLAVLLALANVLFTKGDGRAASFLALYDRRCAELASLTDPDPTGALRWVQASEDDTFWD